ncbi:MAG: hypothetical protein HQ538_06595, partial [Parcubacteria group bacterium]|nr:hypothetical protein [Parcubacteria group bacterium]
MKIGIISSMQFVDKMIEARDKLIKMGHDAFASKFCESMVGKSNEEIEKIKLDQKYNKDAIREFWNSMQGADAVLVLNFDKKGIKNYIGGNTLMEIGFAYVLKQKIFLWNDIPDMDYCRTEIEAVKSVIINGDLN